MRKDGRLNKLKRFRFMELKNPFSNNTRSLFVGCYSCIECSHSDRGLEAHHILKRVSNSPLNLGLLCVKCHHDKGDIHSFKKRQKYLQKTLSYLTKHGYQMTPKDDSFLIKYQIYYQVKIV